MKKLSAETHQLTQLRKQAEARLQGEVLGALEKSPDEVRKLVHELRTHQLELEMQNEELRRTQMELAESRDRYIELYDFAPVGYFTLDEKTLIRQVNLTGAYLLGVQRSKLINRKFSDFISPEFQDDFYFLMGCRLNKDYRLFYETIYTF